MIISIVFFVLFAFTIIRTIAYGVYSLKNEGMVGGISVFFLAAASLFTALIILFTE